MMTNKWNGFKENYSERKEGNQYIIQSAWSIIINDYFFSKIARLALQSIETPDNPSSINIIPNVLKCFWQISFDSYANIWVIASIGSDGANLKRKKKKFNWKWIVYIYD